MADDTTTDTSLPRPVAGPVVGEPEQTVAAPEPVPEPLESPEPLEPPEPVADVDSSPLATPSRRARRGGGFRTPLLAGLIGGLVGALIAAGLFVTLDDDPTATSAGSSSTPIVRPSDRVARTGDIASIAASRCRRSSRSSTTAAPSRVVRRAPAS